MSRNPFEKKYGSQFSPEEFFQNLSSNRPALLGLFVVAILLFGVFSSFYTVRVEEKAVVTRLGRFLETTGSGLHFKLPFGIDKVTLVPIKVQQQSFGFYSPDPSNASLQSLFGSRYRSVAPTSDRALSNESLMLTGDLNVADVQWVVQYKVTDPRAFLFHVAEPIKNIRDLSQTTMRRVVGDISINDVLTVGKKDVEIQALTLMQETLDEYGMGISVEAVNLQDVDPPGPVQPSFNTVNSALQEQKQAINRAESEYNKVIPEARGKADEQISISEGYAAALLNTAKGDSEKFSKVLAAYEKAPDVTQRRLYLESMEKLFAHARDVIVIDENLRSVLPLLAASGAGSGHALPFSNDTSAKGNAK